MLQGGPGFGNSNHKYVMSYASISDSSNKYIYVIVGNGTNAVKVYRQID